MQTEQQTQPASPAALLKAAQEPQGETGQEGAAQLGADHHDPTVKNSGPCEHPGSIGIRKAFDGCFARVIATTGTGDQKLTLWYCAAKKLEAIETNGDPVFPGDEGFDEVRAVLVQGGVK